MACQHSSSTDLISFSHTQGADKLTKYEMENIVTATACATSVVDGDSKPLRFQEIAGVHFVPPFMYCMPP